MVHRSMRGVIVDMEKLTKQHELMPAIGNMKVNARGDELGAGGKIVRKREEIVAEYYNKPVKVQPDTEEIKVTKKGE
jgi:hypothetical protein